MPKPAVSVKVLGHTTDQGRAEDNAEGSSSRLELSERQQSVLVGTLLGDGCLAKHGRYHRLHVKHKAAHRSLVEFKREVFAEFTTMRLHGFDQKLKGKRYPCFQFATRTSPVFSEWHNRFYEGRRKIVPNGIDLSPLAVAVWFMDDGAADYAGVTFQTHSFRADEVERLVRLLNRKFHLAANSRENKGKRLIYVSAAGLPRLRDLIDGDLLPDFRYKLIPRRERTP